MVADIYAAALSTDTKPGTIRLWIHRGELTHRGYDRRRRVRVDLNELEALIDAKTESALATA